MKTKKLKGVLITLLAVVLLIAMSVPSFMLVGAKADETVAKSINIGTSDIKVPTGGWSTTDGHYINFGKGNGDELGDYNGKALKYRVLSKDGNTMLIDSDEILLDKEFDGTDNDYAGSTVRAAIYDGSKFFPNATEKNIVKITDLTSKGTSGEQYFPERYTTEAVYGYYDDASSGNYSFLLSAQQVNDLYKSNDDAIKSGFDTYWLLRSAWSDISDYIGLVYPDGELYFYDVTTANGVAPASNLDLTNVLFSADADFSKTDALTEVNTTDTKTWNLTIKDTSKTVTAQKGTMDTNKKVSVPVKLSGSNITQVSVVITNGDISSSETEILYYGKMDDIDTTITTEQTGTFTLPSDFDADTDKVYILAEDLTSATSDLASAPVEISWDNLYSVEFDTNGATSGTADKQIIKYGEKIDKQAIAGVAKENYKLVGWFENSDFSGAAFDLDTPIEKSIKLYAKWEKEDKTTTKTTKVTKASDSADNAKTGDKVNIGLLAVLALSSLATGTGMVAVARRKDK